MKCLKDARVLPFLWDHQRLLCSSSFQFDTLLRFICAERLHFWLSRLSTSFAPCGGSSETESWLSKPPNSSVGWSVCRDGLGPRNSGKSFLAICFRVVILLRGLWGKCSGPDLSVRSPQRRHCRAGPCPAWAWPRRGGVQSRLCSCWG